MRLRTGTMYLAGALAAIGIAGALGHGWRHVGDDATAGVLAAVRAAAFETDIGSKSRNTRNNFAACTKQPRHGASIK